MNLEYTNISSLISQIHNYSSNFLKTRLTQEGLPELVSSHGFILYKLSLTESLTMTDLAKSINKDKSTTTALIKKLEIAGLIERKSSDKDRRVIYIQLSQKGAKFADAMSSISKELTETCYKNFTEQEKAVVFELLIKLSRNFEEVKPD